MCHDIGAVRMGPRMGPVVGASSAPPSARSEASGVPVTLFFTENEPRHLLVDPVRAFSLFRLLSILSPPETHFGATAPVGAPAGAVPVPLLARPLEELP